MALGNASAATGRETNVPLLWHNLGFSEVKDLKCRDHPERKQLELIVALGRENLLVQEKQICRLRALLNLESFTALQAFKSDALV